MRPLSTAPYLLALIAGALSQTPTFHLNITAISAANNAARLECWQLAAPPVLGRGAVNFALGDITGAFVGVIPPNTTAGTLNNAPQVQYGIPSVRDAWRGVVKAVSCRYSLFLSGLARITTPDSGLPAELNEVYVAGGGRLHGMVIAADLKEVAAKGHVTVFPGPDRTVIAQFPVAGNEVPEHSVLHVGPCTLADVAEL